jgi:hypothetical protein
MKRFTNSEGAALGSLVAGLLIGVVGLVADLAGAASWTHAFTFVGGLAAGTAIVVLVQSSIERRKGTGIVSAEDERLS